MAKEKKPIYSVLLTICLIVSGLLAAINIVSIVSPETSIWIRISSVLVVLALVAAIIYIAKGYSKDMAWAYFAFLICYIGGLLFSLINSAVLSHNIFSIVIAAIVYGLVIAIAVSKDLGERNSMMFCGIIVLLCVIKFVENSAKHSIISPENDALGTILSIRYASQLLLAILLTVITYAKYLDKADRKREAEKK